MTSSDPKHPKSGDLLIDATGLKAKDLTPEQAQKCIRLRAGALNALQHVFNLSQQQLDEAGISPNEISRITGEVANYKYADELVGPTSKLAELAVETKIDSGHQIACFITEVAGQVRRRAERGLLDDEILAALEELFEYQYGPAAKALLTKAKKAKAEAEAAKQAAEAAQTQNP